MAFNRYQYYFLDATLKEKFDEKIAELFHNLTTAQAFNLNKIETLLVTQEEVDEIENWDDCELINCESRIEELIEFYTSKF